MASVGVAARLWCFVHTFLGLLHLVWVAILCPYSTLPSLRSLAVPLMLIGATVTSGRSAVTGCSLYSMPRAPEQQLGQSC